MNLKFIELILTYDHEGELKWNIGSTKRAKELFHKINQGSERARHELVAHVVRQLCILIGLDEDRFLQYYKFIKEHGIENNDWKEKFKWKN